MENQDSKKCPKCGRKLSFGSFYRDKQSGKVRGYCKRCTRKRITERNLVEPGYLKFIGLKHKFGITREDYDLLLITQEGKCAICDTEVRLLKRPLVVDHNHKTGKVRGLLCYSCNMALGQIKDNPETATKMANYLLLYY